jgi:hypothetical protein
MCALTATAMVTPVPPSPASLSTPTRCPAESMPWIHLPQVVPLLVYTSVCAPPQSLPLPVSSMRYCESSRRCKSRRFAAHISWRLSPVWTCCRGVRSKVDVAASGDGSCYRWRAHLLQRTVSLAARLLPTAATVDGRGCYKGQLALLQGCCQRQTRLLQRVAGLAARLLPAAAIDTGATKAGWPYCNVVGGGGLGCYKGRPALLQGAGGGGCCRRWARLLQWAAGPAAKDRRRR